LERAETTKIDAKSRRGAKNHGFLAQLVREAFSEQFFDDFGSFFALTFVIFCGDIARASRLAARRANVAISLVFCS
jgi:hypothetical protein